MRRAAAYILACVMALSVSVLAGAQTFEGDGLSIRLSPTGSDGVQGHVARDGATYPLTGRAAADGGRARISGSFTANGAAFLFSAVRDGDSLVFETGTKTYRLKAAAAPAAAATGPGKIVLGKVEIRDIHMDNVVSHTMYVPEGWTFKGHTEWSQGSIIFPQQNIQIRSPDGYTVSFQPAAHLAYSEMDPNFAMQLKQNGLWDPNQHKERIGIPPPNDIGQFLVDFITRNNQAVSDVRLVSQNRDRATEEMYAKMIPPAPNSTTEIHVVNIAYTLNGVVMQEEVNLMYTRHAPVRGPSTIWNYSIVTTSIVGGPAEGFARNKPLLYCIANSLRTTPNWQHCKQKVLIDIQNARHQANMQQIQQWGDAIRRAGQEYSKMTDAHMKNWKAQQKIDDDLQRDRINRIYDLYTVTDPEGNRIAVPLGYPHVYRSNDGKLIATQQPIENPQGLTPVETKG